jgi:transglutaminase-like putative cysteine protease
MQKAPFVETVLLNLRSYIQKNQPARPWDWQSTLLVVALVQIASTRLVISEWVPNLIIIESVSLLAVTLGLLLGYSNFTAKISTWIAIEYGLLILPISLLNAVDRAERTEFLSDDLRSLLARLFDSIVLFFRNQPIYDTLFFILLMSVGFWLVGCYVGYRLTRYGSFLDAIFIPGLVMLVIQTYDSWVTIRAWGLAFFLFTSLALLGRIQYLESKKEWKKKRVFLASDTEQGFSRSILYTAAFTVFIAWALPGAISSIQPISKAWHTFTEPFTERFSNAVTALDSPYGTSTSGDFYGSELILGSKAPVSDTPVLFVKAPKDEPGILRYYWRGRVYDTYQDGHWLNLNSQRIPFNPTIDEISIDETNSRVEVDLKVTVNFPKQELVYAPSEIDWFNREGKLIVAPAENGNQEVLGIVASPGLVSGDSYEVHAKIATPTIQELRAAGTDYPGWISERYTQVPENIENRLRELAENITEPYTNPFDKAQAITSYLRTIIKYQTNIEETPSGEDPLLWVLFDYKKGFCMYSASAEVLMLRSLGIPARMAVGFAEGTYDQERGRYTIARLDAHAWPEVYFPGIGWIEFEPTGNQQPLDRPLAPRDESDANQANATPTTNNPLTDLNTAEGDSTTFNPSIDQPGEITVEENMNPWPRFVALILATALIVLGYLLSKRYAVAERLPAYLVNSYSKNGAPPPGWLAYWAYWAQLLPIEKSYQTINLCLRWLGVKQPAHNTPQERAEALTQVLPAAASDIQNLSMEYQNAMFAAQPANLRKARRSSLNILTKSLVARAFHYKEIPKRRYN